MQENKSLVQEALIQMKNVEEAIAENAKGILASTMKEEINQLVKESLSEQDEDEVDLDVDMEDDDSEEFDVDMDTDNEDEMDMDFDMDMDSDEESPIDLTDASDEEILKVFKAMGEEDGIIVKKDGNDIHLTDSDTDEEYLVKLGESEEDTMDETMNIEEIDEMDVDTEDVINAIFSKDGDASDIEVDQDEEVMYEIEFEEDDDDMMEQEDDDDMMEQEDDDDMMESDDDDMMEQEDDDDMMEEEDDLDESYNQRRAVREAKSTIKPKGVGIGSGPKFTYKDKAKGGFDDKKKEGPKSVGTGKSC